MSKLFNLSHWAEVLAQNGLVLLGQTSLLLGLGLLTLRVLQARPTDARDLLGRALLVSTLAGVALSFGFSLGGWNRPAVLWNLSLPARPVVLTNSSTTTSSALLRAQLSIPDRQLGESAQASPSKEARDMQSASSPTHGELLSATGNESTARLAPLALQETAMPEVNKWSSLLYLAVGLWVSGACGLILWWGMCHELLRRLRCSARPVEDAAVLSALSEVCTAAKVRVPCLMRHPKVSSPFLMGLSKPTILLPANDLDPAMLRAIFSHEAMHLRRRDLWWNALGRVGCALLWPQPLFWMLCRQIEANSEEACDRAVLEAGCPRQQYAKCLLDFAERLAPRGAECIAGIGMAPGKSSIARRVQTILSTSQTRAQKISTRGRWLIGAGTLLAAIAMPLLVSGSAAPEKPTSGAPKSVSNGPRMLQRYQTVGDYGISINGVENGVLQFVVIRQRRAGVLRQMIIARTAQRQGDSARWILSDGTTYGFSDEKGLVLEAPFKSLVLNAPTFAAYLKEQSQAASQPLSDKEMKQLESSLELRSSGLNAFQVWAKKQPRVAISGRVLGEGNRPIAGARIVVQMDYQTERSIPGQSLVGRSASMVSFAFPKLARDLLSQVVTSRADGTYRIDGLAPVRYELRASEADISQETDLAQGKPPAQVLKAIARVLPRVGQITLAPNLELTRGGLLRVRVLDKISGAPLPEVLIFGSIKGRPGINVPTNVLKTDAKGEALFRLPAERVHVGLGGQQVPGSRNFAVNSNGTYYAMNQGNELSLDGAPLQRIGGAAYLNIIPGRTREATLRLARFMAPIPKPVPTAAPRLLPPAGKAALTGRVVDESGRPVAGVAVRALIQRQAQWKLMQGAGLALSNGSTPGFKQKWASIDPVLFERTTTGVDGNFRLNGLTTAPYNLVVGAWRRASDRNPPAGNVASAVEGVWAKEGKVVRRAQPIVLTNGALIEGRIVDKATGKPLGGVIIGANGPQLPTSTDNTMSATSDALGRFRFRVAPGDSSLYVQGPWNNDTNFAFADDGKSAENVARIRTSRGVYAGTGNVQFEINGGALQFGLNFGSTPDKSQWRIKIPVQSRQTSRITLYLRHLVPKKPVAEN